MRDLVCEDAPQDYTLRFRVYGVDGVRMVAPADEPPPGEVFIMGECIAPTPERASEVVRTCKQYLLHHGYPGRLSTAGNLAFPFTPPEVSLGAGVPIQRLPSAADAGSGRAVSDGGGNRVGVPSPRPLPKGEGEGLKAGLSSRPASW